MNGNTYDILTLVQMELDNCSVSMWSKHWGTSANKTYSSLVYLWRLCQKMIKKMLMFIDELSLYNSVTFQILKTQNIHTIYLY